MRILVADDDREIVELLNIYLHNEGYDVIKAYNGHQALSYIKNDVDHEIGLIILDIMVCRSWISYVPQIMRHPS